MPATSSVLQLAVRQASAPRSARPLIPALALVMMLLVALPGTGQAQVCGDCNMDGFITVLDALRGAKFAAGLAPPSPPTPPDFVVCDVNDNGTIEILDALLMAQAAAGLVVVLTCPSSCVSTPPNIDADYIPLQTASPPRCRDLSIPFVIVDAESDTCSIVVEFSTSAGSSWTICSEAPGSSGTSGLASSPAGSAHTFIWDSDSVADLDVMTHMNVQARMTVMDCVLGNTDRSLPGFTVANGNTAPTAVFQGAAPPYALHGSRQVSYFLFDNEADLCTLLAQASTDGGVTWQMAAQGPGGDGTSMLTSALLGVSHVFDWDVDGTYAPGWSSAQLRLRLTPSDCGNGIADTRIFPGGGGCQPTQTPPTTTVTTSLSGMIFAATVPFDFTVTDANSDLVDMLILYSTDNGISFPGGQVCTPAAGSDSTTDIPATPAGVSRHFVWDAFGDLGAGTHMNLRVRLTPSDFCGVGPDEIAPDLAFPPFEVGCPAGATSPPTVVVTTALAGMTFSGALPVNFNVVDADSHPVNVEVRYSTDGGATYPSLATLTQPNPRVGLASSPGGTASSITWDTTADLPGATFMMCKLQFIPSDFCDMGTPVVAPAGGTFIVDNAVSGFGPGVFACHTNSSTIYFVSTSSPQTVAPIGMGSFLLPPGVAPFDAVIDPVTGDRLYIACNDAIYIVDANTHTIIDANPMGGGPSDPIMASNMTGEPCATWGPQQMEISPDGLFLYLNIYSCSGGFVLMKVNVGAGSPYVVPWSIPQGFFGKIQGEFALSPDGTRIVTCNNNNYDTDCGLGGCPQINPIGCLALTCATFPALVDCCNTDSVSFVNTTTGVVINTISNMGNNPLWAAFNAAGTKCYVTEFGYLDLCIDGIFCDLLGAEVHRYDTSGPTMVEILPTILVPCPVCGTPGSPIQEGSFPSGIYPIPGLERMYITDPANEAGNVCVLNTATDLYESTSGLPLGVFTPMMTGPLGFAPHHMAFDAVRNLAYIIEFDQMQSRIRVINYSVGTFGALDITKDTSFGAFGSGSISGLAVKQ